MQTPQPMGGGYMGDLKAVASRKSVPYYLLEANAVFQGIHYGCMGTVLWWVASCNGYGPHC